MPGRRSLEELRAEFACDEATAHRLKDLYDVGYRHGKKGWYPGGDFSSDADWCYGTGEAIRKLEDELDVVDDSVFELYRDGHAEGLELNEKKG